MRAWPLALALAILAPAAASAQSVREVAALVHEQGGYGEQLRIGPEGGGTLYGGSGRPPLAREPSSPRARTPRGGGVALGAASGALAYLLIALAVGAVLALMVALLVRMRPREGALAPAAAVRRESLAPASPLPGRGVDLDADPEALAAQGLFAEAIAAALIRSLFAVGWRPQGLAKSRTAREILASVGDAEQHRRLDALVRIEERVAFGGDEPTRERWERARDEWRALIGAGA